MTGTRGLSAGDERKSLRNESAGALRSALHETDIDQLALADAAGIDPAQVSRKASRKCDETWNGVDLVRWLRDDETRPVGLRLMQWIGTQTGLDIVAKRAAAGTADLLAHLGAVTDAAHGVQRAILDGISPLGESGTEISDDELARIEAKAAEARRVATEAEHAAANERIRRGHEAARRLS